MQSTSGNARAQIRNLAPGDILAVWQLGIQAFDWPSERVLWDEFTVRWFVAYARRMSFVAICGDQIVGFILCYVAAKQGYLAWIAVGTQWRRQGIGRRLMRRALSALQSVGVETVSSCVREDGNANLLFESCGFQNIGLRKLDLVLHWADGSVHNDL